VGVRASDGKLSGAIRRGQPHGQLRHAGLADTSFFTSAYGTAGRCLDERAEATSRPRKLFHQGHEEHHGGVVWERLISTASPIHPDLHRIRHGQKMWASRRRGQRLADLPPDGMLYLFSENNTVGLAEATPNAYVKRTIHGFPSRAAELAYRS